jgi:DNA-binding response OmpR family regulator
MARILLTEDDASVRAFVSRALQLDGHEVVTADDGEMALETLHAEEAAFDLLLSDIKMPAMDGIALARATAREWPGLPILLMTGYADQRERAEDLAAIIHDVVGKPFSLGEIRERVREALAAKAAGRSRPAASARTAGVAIPLPLRRTG